MYRRCIYVWSTGRLMSDFSDSDTPNLSKARRISRTMSSSSSDADTSGSASDTDDRSSSPAGDADSSIFEADHEHITVVENAAISLDEAIKKNDQDLTIQLPNTVEIYFLNDAETQQFQNPKPVEIKVTEQGPVLRKQSILHKICGALKDENSISTFMYRSKILSDALQIYQFPKDDYSIVYEPGPAPSALSLALFLNLLPCMKVPRLVDRCKELNCFSPNCPGSLEKGIFVS